MYQNTVIRIAKYLLFKKILSIVYIFWIRQTNSNKSKLEISIRLYRVGAGLTRSTAVLNLVPVKFTRKSLRKTKSSSFHVSGPWFCWPSRKSLQVSFFLVLEYYSCINSTSVHVPGCTLCTAVYTHVHLLNLVHVAATNTSDWLLYYCLKANYLSVDLVRF